VAKKRVGKYALSFRQMAMERMKGCPSVSALADELGVQPFTTPDLLHPILAHLPACMLEQRGDAAIAITPVLLG
jgi:hypothetical protein